MAEPEEEVPLQHAMAKVADDLRLHNIAGHWTEVSWRGGHLFLRLQV